MAIVDSGVFSTMAALPAFHPGGTPSVGDGDLDKKVDKMPCASVLVAITTTGAMVGSALAFTGSLFSIGLYVLVASAENTILPTEAGTDVLNAYSGVE
jgi:hypothetical protein